MKTITFLISGLTASISIATPIHAAELILNGGFETGNFSSWTATTNGSLSCDTDWNVSSVGGSIATGCQPNVFGGTFPAAPIEGNFAAYNSFDGDGPQSFVLSQSVTLPNSIGSAILSWQETFNVDLTVGASAPRTFSIDVNGVEINSQTIGIVGSQVESDWTLFSEDITALLTPFAGQTATFSFTNFIPEFFTGPAGFGLDAVSLDVSPANVPEPTGVLSLGFIACAAMATRKRRSM
jgi:hypothetical protein